MAALLICAISIVSLATVLSGCSSTEPAAESSSSAHEAPATSSEEAKEEAEKAKEEAEKAKEEAEEAKREAEGAKERAEETERGSQQEAEGSEKTPSVESGSSGGKSAEGPGSYSHAEDGRFCAEHECIGDFTGEDGYVVECSDGSYSHAGGISGSCSHHGGDS